MPQKKYFKIFFFFLFAIAWKTSFSAIDEKSLKLYGKIKSLEGESVIIENDGKDFRVPVKMVEERLGKDFLKSAPIELEMYLSSEEIKSLTQVKGK